ncbi:DUF2975 domain-containing protein [Cupriavidus taiwanensis]|uniref:DUF2975 domain-containing protein n=1 Tax=Cupriavidus taiwanensis TaxID=164546 RepID=UPI000E106588|nr:DUF2975 domain-containing protein [Cupriavidus taiwanensis]SPA54687.1 conserved membrane protein of unknown function [Cupriavidus taiwanensis]
MFVSSASPIPEGAALHRIRTLSRTMQRLTTFGGAVALVSAAWIWFGSSAAELERVVRGITHASTAYPVQVLPMHRAAGFLATGIGLTLLICVLHQARRMFVAFGRGEVLTIDTAIRLRRMALALTAMGPAIPLIRLLTGVALVGVPGKPYWIIAITLSDYFVSLLGGLLLAIAWAMLEAVRIAEENKGFV